MADQLAGGKGVLVGDGDDLVIDLGVQHVRHKACADALNLMRTGHALAQHRGGGGLDSHNLHVGVLALEILADAGHRAASADTGHKDVDLAVGILPNFGAGGALVSVRVGRVHKLAGHKAVGNFLGQLVRLGNGTLHALGTVGQHQLGAVGLHQLAALHAHRLGHNDDDAVAAGGGHGGQTNAGVAGGRLDDDRAGLQLAGGLGIVNHRLGNAVLDRAGGVEIFQLAQNLGFQVFSGFNMGELQQGRAANQLVSGSINLAHRWFLHCHFCLFKKCCALTVPDSDIADTAQIPFA